MRATNSVVRVIAVLCAGLAGACGKPSLAPELAQRGISTYADIALAGYEDALALANELQSTVDALSVAPSEPALAAARAAWRAARVPYLQTETYRFYEGPIDRVELLLNTWPVDESYVEAVIDDPQRYPTLDGALLVSLNARDSETSISTGYHVIEFLLWGRDPGADGVGSRTVREFVQAPRLRSYLQLSTRLLVQHLTQVVADWRGPYREALLAMPTPQALTLALRGMGTLSGPELAGERLTVPYETRDQENEQSCFSDTTDQDVRLDARGVQNVCLGNYRRSNGTELKGPGICTLIGALDPALQRELEAQIAASVRAAEAIPAPFDRALTGKDDAPGRAAIKRTIDALQAQTDSIARAAALVGGGRS